MFTPEHMLSFYHLLGGGRQAMSGEQRAEQRGAADAAALEAGS